MLVILLDKKSRIILKKILNSNSRLSIQNLSESTGFARRSIYYHISKINNWLKTNGLSEITLNGKQGIFLSENTKNKILKLLHDQTEIAELYEYAPIERENIIYILILIRKNITIDELSNVLMVSRNTVINDIDALRDNLEEHQLCLEYVNRKGYKVIGDQIVVRTLFLSSVHIVDDLMINQILTENELLTINEIRRELDNIEIELKKKYVHKTLSPLAWLIYCFQRDENQSLYKISFTDDIDSIKNSYEYVLVNKSFSNLSLPNQEYITLYLLSAHLQSNPSLKVERSEESKEISKELIKEFKKISCMDLYDEKRLFQALCIHMSSAIYRYRFGMMLDNSLLENVKAEYSQLFILTKEAVKHVNMMSQFVITDDEISFLTLHFGTHIGSNDTTGKFNILILCPHGIGTSNMIKSEIRRLVPFANKIDNKPYGIIDYSDYDLIVSTVDVKNGPLEKFIRVNAILSDNDKIAILNHTLKLSTKTNNLNKVLDCASKYMSQDVLSRFKKDLIDEYALSKNESLIDIQPNYGKNLLYYLSEDKINIRFEETDWKTAIQIAAKPLVSNYSIQPTYVDKIIEYLIRYHSYMFIANETVLGHARPEDGGIREDITLFIFKHPVLFTNNRSARIIMILASKNQTEHLNILKDIYKVFGNAENISNLCKSQTKEEVLFNIKKMLLEND